MQDTAINVGFIIMYILVIVALIGVIVFPLIQMAGDLKAAKGTLFGILGLIVLFLVCYAVSPADTGAFYDKMNVSSNLYKAIGAGLLATYVVFAGVLISIAFAQISNWLK